MFPNTIQIWLLMEDVTMQKRLKSFESTLWITFNKLKDKVNSVLKGQLATSEVLPFKVTAIKCLRSPQQS